MLDITFYGVRGSTPCSGPETQEFGGNTSCVLVAVGDEPPIICDLGTGVRRLGHDLSAASTEPVRASALLSHLHWDHVQGVPFFAPILKTGSSLDVYGPVQNGRSLLEIVEEFVAPPLFPVSLKQLPGSCSFTEVGNQTFAVGSATVTAFDVEHAGPTNGYRIDAGGGSVAYISDCQEPLDGSRIVPDVVLEACADVDILIHDAQYSAAELAQRPDWGHCTPDYALAVAVACRAKRLVLFHHDPAHDDTWVRSEVARLREAAASLGHGDGIDVLAAFEGLTLHST